MAGPDVFAIGDKVEGATILALLGKGAMGAVYRARDASGREVALKTLVVTEGDAEARFHREAEALLRLPHHPSIVGVLGAGSFRGRPWLSMELVPGETLEAILARGPLEPVRAAVIGAALADGVAHVHAHGVLHRDLKPGNVIVRADGTPVLTDFGLARVTDGERLTRTGEILGTPTYMSPEQALGDHASVDARTDVHALGALLHHMLTGAPPFEGPTLVPVKLDIDLDEIHLNLMLESGPPVPGTDAPARYLSLRIRIGAGKLTAAEARESMSELAADVSLGPRTRAHALEIVARADADRRLELLARAADELDPDSPQRVHALARALRDAGKKDEAIQRFRETLARFDKVGTRQSTIQHLVESKDELERMERAR